MTETFVIEELSFFMRISTEATPSENGPTSSIPDPLTEPTLGFLYLTSVAMFS